MTLRVIDRLQQGRLTSFASIVAPMLAVAFLVALAREPGPLDRGTGADREGRASAPGAVALVAGESATCIPTAAHVAGAAGTSWRTDLEVHNPGTTQASYSIALLKHGEVNTSPVTQSFNLGSGQSMRYGDVVHDRFAFDGKAALRVTATSGTVVVTSRTYNDQPAGSYGQFVPAFPDGGAIGADREGRLIQLSHQPSAAAGGFRTNLGVVNTGSGTIAVTVDLYASAGTHLGQVPMTLRGYEYQQVDKVFERVTRTLVAGGYAVVRTSTAGGRFFAYASVIDNRTGDPVFIPASSLPRGSAPPTPTPTPTRTPTRTPTSPPGGTVNLKPYTPPGWPGCVVCNYRQSSPPVSEALYINQTTYVYWAIANLGTTTFTGPLKFGYYFDGTRIFDLTWSNPDGLPPNYYQPFLPTAMTVYATGQHTVEVRIDPDGAVAESNEADNACAFAGTWSGAPLAPPALGETASLLGGTVVATLPPRPIETTIPQAATMASYIATSAHASGVAGTNWRTDLELHNAGTTPASVSIALLKHGQSNSSPDGLSVPVAPGQAVRYTDAVFDLFSFSGKAALRLETSSGMVVATSRTYNDQPGGSYGQFVPASPEGEAIGSDREGRLIQLSHQPNAALGGFRTNIGAVNAGSGQIAVTIDLYASSGAYLGQVPMSLRAYEYQQIDKVFERVAAGAVASGYAVVRTSTTGGRFFAYASVIDNRTGDPVFIPASNLPRGSAPPTPTPGVVTGPGGTSITLPSGGTTPDAVVTITSGSGTYLPQSGETLVSTVIKVNVGGEGVSTGAGSYVVRIPVTGTVTDPSKLLLKVQTSVGPVYPVAGVYESGTKTFSAELMRLWNGWNMGVVVNPGLRVSVPSMAEDGEVGVASWVTPMDWQTCSWSISSSVPVTSATTAFAADVKTALVKACQHLSGASFRSPKLWVDGRLNPKARVAHIVQGTGDNDPRTSFRMPGVPEEDPAFAHIAFNDEQMHSLGQLYFNWDEYQTYFTAWEWTNGHLAIHELLHGVQSGYDVRDPWYQEAHPFMWVAEGTSTIVGMTYQTNANGINGGTVTVRPQEPPQILDEQVHSYSGTAAYARQDFFAYFARRYNGGSFRNLADLYQQLANATDGQFGKSFAEYDVLYRRGMNAHFSQSLNVTLPEAYIEFAVDRAYRHRDAALLRSADRALPMGSLDRSLFKRLTTWDPSVQTVLCSREWDTAGRGVNPLQTWAIKVNVPASARSAGVLQIPVQVGFAPLSREGVRIFIFRESGGVQTTEGEMEITDISQPVNVPVSSSIQTLTILVVNGSVDHKWAEVTFGQQPWTTVSHGYTEAHTCNNPPSCTNTCTAKSADPDPKYFPITWIGDTFSYEVPGHGKIDGKLSADGQSMEYYRAVLEGGVVIRHFTNLPKIPGRSSANLAVFGVSGADALSHIATFKVCLWGVQGDYDLTKPLVLEAWLAR